jgi:hypothetical protein
VRNLIIVAAMAAVAALGVTWGAPAGNAAPAAARPAPHRQLVFQVTVPGGETLTEVCAFQSQTARNTFYACGYQTRP